MGQTPLIKIESLSKLTGCSIWGKAEFLNPGGSVKDRAAKGIILDAEARGVLRPGGTIVEGTAGNTGIGLATLAAERGYKVIISMPNNQAVEKYETLRVLGAELHLVDPCPFTNQNHFYHQARRLAETNADYFWADQFENKANGEFHFKTTGPEIWEQTNGQIDYLTMASGTGGTISGTSRFLKTKNLELKVILADPNGSGMCSYVKSGQILSQGSSVTEGIGIMRLTQNFNSALIDDAVTVDDQQMISMMYHIAKNDGLILGTSAALNLFSAYKIGLKHKNQNKNIVTILCDHGSRYFSRVFSKKWLETQNLNPLPLEAVTR